MIDILIPFYNVDSKTFRRCLSSIASQTIVDKIEVTICDDCSPITCTDIIEQFSENVKIKYMKNETNLGVGLTRKKLIENSNNKYIMWVDADDVLADCLVVERFLQKMEENKDTQLVVGGYYRYHGNLKVEYTGFNITWLFSKMYKRSELDKFDINFNGLKCNEDACYNAIVFSCFDKYKFIDEPMYLWQDNENSITRSKDKDTFQHRIDYANASIYVVNWLNNHNFKYTEVAENWKYDGIIQSYWEYCNIAQESSEMCNKYMDKIFEYYKMVVTDINDFANSDIFHKRYNIIPRQCIPTITIFDWLWKLAERNGEFK